MGMESIRVDLLIRKLSFLKRLLDENAVGIGSIAMKSLMDDPESICLVKECRSLEGDYGTSYTDKLLTNADEVGLRTIIIRKRDKARLVRKCTTKAPLIVEVNRRGGHWRATWDSVLQCGSRHTTGLQFLTRILTHHGHGSKPCPLCEDLLHGQELAVHILQEHSSVLILPPSISLDSLLSQIADRDI